MSYSIPDFRICWIEFFCFARATFRDHMWSHARPAWAHQASPELGSPGAPHADILIGVAHFLGGGRAGFGSPGAPGLWIWAGLDLVAFF